MREVATQALHRVAEGAWASPVLDSAIRRAGLSRRDAALATQIVYGALRVLPSLDLAIDAHLRRPDTDAYARAALRAAAFQILHLSRVPPHAAVDAAVTLVRRARGKGVAGFVNAVLRKVAATRPASPEPPDRVELPSWLADSVERALGPDRAEAFVRGRPMPPPIGLRVSDPSRRDEIVERLRAARPRAQVLAGRVAATAVLVRGGGDPKALPGWAEGDFSVQEQGSQRIAELLGVREGRTVVDACAGRGGKTLALLPRAGDGRVIALDLHEPKLDRLAEDLARLGWARDRVERVAVDLTVGLGGVRADADRVLVDAPCTGIGTVHRRPELLLRLTESEPARMGAIQLAIAARAAELLAPGGELVLAVCSPLDEEGADVVTALVERVPRLVSHPEGWPAGTPVDPDGAVRLGPWQGDCDAYQCFRLRAV